MAFRTSQKVNISAVEDPKMKIQNYKKFGEMEIEETISSSKTLSKDAQDFAKLVKIYGDHQKSMKDSFLDKDQKEPKLLRKLEPSDVSKLGAVEFPGLMYWIEKLHPYKDLQEEDKAQLLQKYSVRKLSLDHFYSASKHPGQCARGEFVMNNYTFVPKDRTGFELEDDDELQIVAKREAFGPTFQRFWINVVHPFVTMKVTDADVTFMHLMLLWSASSSGNVTESTQKIMKKQRDSALEQIFQFYSTQAVQDPALRVASLIQIIGEIEVICDMHIEDFQVAKMFEFCDMSKFWYETLCYSSKDKADLYGNLVESMKRLVDFEDDEDKENRAPMSQKSSKKVLEAAPIHVDPSFLVFNAHLLPDVMAPLPDDNCYENFDFF